MKREISEIASEIEEARALLSALEAEYEQSYGAVAICRRDGCDMQFSGGASAGCCQGCDCSVPVHVCSRCGDSDYGDTDEADRLRRECAEQRFL